MSNQAKPLTVAVLRELRCRLEKRAENKRYLTNDSFYDHRKRWNDLRKAGDK